MHIKIRLIFLLHWSQVYDCNFDSNSNWSSYFLSMGNMINFNYDWTSQIQIGTLIVLIKLSESYDEFKEHETRQAPWHVSRFEWLLL